jgi:hypothetical protein
MVSSSRLFRAALMAGACGLFFATHVFVEYVGIRAKLVTAPIAATDGMVRASVTPAKLKDLRAPFALIARIRNAAGSSEQFVIQVDDTQVCDPSIAAKSTHRVDCVLNREWNSRVPHEVTIRSSASQWTLEYLEFATHHGSSSGALTLVVLPAVSNLYVKPGPGWIAFLWLVLWAVLLVPAWPLPRLLSVLHKVVLGFFILWAAVCLFSSWVSRYSIVVYAGSLLSWLVLLMAPRIYLLIRGPLMRVLRLRPAWFSASETAERLPPEAFALDVLAGSLLLFGVVIECTGPTSQIHPFGIGVSINAAGCVAALALIMVLRHWRVPRHPILVRLFPAFGDPTETGEARLFGPPGESRLRTIVEIGIVGLAFSALVAIATWPQVGRLDAVPDHGDPLFSVWRIAWVAHQITRNPLHVFDANMFYPERLTLAYSDPVLVPGLMSAPFFWLGGHPVAIYNLLLLSGFALSGVTTFLLVRSLTGRRDAAAVAGVVFALYPYRFEHYSHLELQMTMWMPLALWGLHRTLASGKRRDGIATGIAVALQALSSLYYGLFLLVYMSALGAVLWVTRRRPLAPLRALAAGALVAGVLIAPVAVEFVRNRPVFSERPIEAVDFYSARAVDYLKPHISSRWYGGWSEDGFVERQLFPGLVVVALAFIALWPPVKAARIGYAAAMVVAFDGSLGVHGIIFPLLRDYVGPFRGLRVPARFSILVGLTLAILAGFAAKRILERWPRWRVPILGALLALVVIEPFPRLALQPVWREPPAIYSGLPTAPSAILAEFPVPPDWRAFAMDARYLYFSTFHWQRLVNGNSGFPPPSYLDLLDHVQGFPDNAALDYLRARGVEYVSVHGAFYEPEAWRRVQIALGARTDLELVVAARWNGSESRLYRLRR